jgi:hypothetical protein
MEVEPVNIRVENGIVKYDELWIPEEPKTFPGSVSEQGFSKSLKVNDYYLVTKYNGKYDVEPPEKNAPKYSETLKVETVAKWAEGKSG